MTKHKKYKKQTLPRFADQLIVNKSSAEMRKKMSLLEITNLTHRYEEKILYKNCSLEFYKGEHIGIVGPNGTGKSTFVKILIGEVIPDEGMIKWQKDMKLGVLNQYAEIREDSSILEYLKTAFQNLYEIENNLNQLYQNPDFSTDSILINQAAALQEELENKNFYQVESEINKVSVGLGLTAIGMEKTLDELSGGQRTKVILGKLLLENAQVIILDEPTNFLDKEHVKWLAEYLKNYKGTSFVVSHDFDFLEEAADCICNMEYGTVKKYNMKYSKFVKQKEKLQQDYKRQYELQQKEIQKTEEFIRKNIAGIKTKMAQGRRKQLEKMERMEKPAVTGRIRIRFREKETGTLPSLKVKNLEIGYINSLLPKMNFEIKGGEKFVITGFNGIGKSTLLKTIIGALNPIKGEYQISETAQIGYYEQDLQWKNKTLNPVQIVAEEFPYMQKKEIQKQLANCGVKGENMQKSISILSGGEQSKVKLCKLLLRPINFLILDEPTNHLDSDTKEALKQALMEFHGTILLVSHEEKFYKDWIEKEIKL